MDGGRRDEAGDYLMESRLEFGRKRSFIKLLDAFRAPGPPSDG